MPAGVRPASLGLFKKDIEIHLMSKHGVVF